jgi:hypothetical protein
VADVLEVLVEEGVAEPVAGIGEQRVDGPAVGRRVKLVDPLERREVGLDGLHLRAEGAKLLGRLMDLGLVGGDEKVEAVPGAFLGELVADAGRGSGDDRKRTGAGGHGCCSCYLGRC